MRFTWWMIAFLLLVLIYLASTVIDSIEPNRIIKMKAEGGFPPLLRVREEAQPNAGYIKHWIKDAWEVLRGG